MSDQVQRKAAITIQKHVRGLLVRNQHKQFVQNLKSRKYVANEILSSERSYVKTLNLLVNAFYKPLKESKVVDVSVIKCIFGNIVEIQAIHSNLLKEMTTSPNFHLGTVFVNCIPTFRAYRAYIANYTSSLTTYNAWLEKKSFADRVKACCGNTGLQPSDLPGLLNQPVTQLARYKLLLEDLFAKTNPQNEDYENLKKAVGLLKQIDEGGPIGESPRSASPTSSVASSVYSLQSTSSSASLARKINAIAQAPHNLPYKLSPFVSRSVSSTPVGASPSFYDPGDPSLPSYLRPTHTSYARANEGRAKKDQVTYINNNTPLWMPNGNPHSEKIYNTPYNAIPYTPRQEHTLERTPSGKTWLPTPATPRSFDNSTPRSASSLSMRESPQKLPSKNKLNSTFTLGSSSSSSRKLLSDSFSSSSLSSALSSALSSHSVPTTPTKASSSKTPSSTPSKSSSSSNVKTLSSKSAPSTPAKPAPSTPSSSTVKTTPSKSGVVPTTPSKVVTAAKAAGSNLPSPSKTTTPSKPTTSGLPKSASQNGMGSKIPVLKKSPSRPTVPESEEVVGNGNGGEEEDETMTF